MWSYVDLAQSHAKERMLTQEEKMKVVGPFRKQSPRLNYLNGSK